MARVLLVADDVDERAQMEHVIRSDGHLLETVATVAKAVALLEEKSFDLVVTDMNLRDGSGLRVADMAKEKGAKGLVVTGGGPSLNPGSLATYDYLSKPLGATALLEAIRRRLPRDETQRPNGAVPNERRVAKRRAEGSATSASSSFATATCSLEGDRRHAERRFTSALINRNVTVAGHRTSMRLEPSMWDAMRQVCDRESKTLNQLVTEIDSQRLESSRTAAIRVYLLRYFCAAATDEGHRLAGHRVLYPMPMQATHGSP